MFNFFIILMLLSSIGITYTTSNVPTAGQKLCDLLLGEHLKYFWANSFYYPFFLVRASHSSHLFLFYPSISQIDIFCHHRFHILSFWSSFCQSISSQENVALEKFWGFFWSCVLKVFIYQESLYSPSNLRRQKCPKWYLLIGNFWGWRVIFLKPYKHNLFILHRVTFGVRIRWEESVTLEVHIRKKESAALELNVRWEESVTSEVYKLG